MTDEYQNLRKAISFAEYTNDAYWLDRYRGESGSGTIRGLLAERDDLLTEVEVLREKVRYFEDTVCCPDMQVVLSNGCSTMAIDPERVADVVLERDRLRQAAGKADYNALENLEVSVDVSTCDEDAAHRVFATITGFQKDGDSVILLAEKHGDNFDRPAPDVSALVETLERIARHPRTRGDELGYAGCRNIAKEALAAHRKLRGENYG